MVPILVLCLLHKKVEGALVRCDVADGQSGALCSNFEVYPATIPPYTVGKPLQVRLIMNFIHLDELHFLEKTITMDIGISFLWTDPRVSLTSAYAAKLVPSTLIL